MIFLGTWITELDLEILEFFESHELTLPPKTVWLNFNSDSIYNSTKRRMRTLESAGLLEKIDEPAGYYKITETGLSVVQGELSKEEINELEPERED